MNIAHLHDIKDEDITTQNFLGTGSAAVQWLIREQDGASNSEMRYFSLKGPVSTERHCHPWEHEVFIVDGLGTVLCEGKEIEIGKGSVVFVPAGEEHQFLSTGTRPDFICVVPKGVGLCSIPGSKK